MKFIRALYLIAALSASSTGMMAQTQSSGYFLHTITKGQSLYSIASMYNVTTGDIVKMNPGSDQKIKTGETLKIPQKNIGTEQQMFHTIQSGETLYKLTQRYGVTAQRICQANPGLSAENFRIGQVIVIPAKVTDSEEIIMNEVKAAQTIRPATTSTPLKPNCRDMHKVERKETIFSISRLYGISIDLYSYDTHNNTSSIKNILDRSELKSMDIIFGPAYPDQVKPVAEFAKKNNIRLVVPFTSKGNEVFSNPAIYQINTPQSYLYSEVYEHFTRKFTTANVIFLDAEDGDKDKVDFIKGLKEELKTKRIPFTELKGENITPESLKGAMNHSMDNVFIPTSGTNVALIKLLPQLIVTSRDNPDYRMQLFGYPEWQTYTNDHLASFYELDTYFYSSFYTNNLFPEAVQFSSAYRKWYSKDMLNSFPKYGMLGFDTGYFFLKGLSQYGNKLEDKLDKVAVTPIQTGFKFERVNNWGGFINRKVFFVHFTKDFELIKLDFE